MKKTVKYLSMLCAAVVSLAFVGCDDPHTDNMGEYMSQIYFRNGGVDQPLIITRIDPTTVYRIPVCKTGFDLSAEMSAVVGIMDQDQLDMYNRQNLTSYELLPAGCFRIKSDANLVFSSDDSYQVVELEVDTGKCFESVEAIAANGNTPVIALQLFSNDKLSKGLNYVIFTPTLERAFVTFGQTEDYIRYMSTDPEVNTYSNTLRLNVSNDWDFTCDVELQDNIDEIIAAVNEKYKGEGLKYKLLPEGAYSFDKTIAFKKGSEIANFDITVNRIFKNFLEDPNSEREPCYILPLKIGNVSKSGLELDEQNSTLLVRFTHEMELLEMTFNDVELKASMLSSPCTYEGNLGLLVDGNAETFWGSYYSGQSGDPIYGYYIDIALETPAKFFKFAYQARHNNSNAIPRLVTIGGSVDGQNWDVIAEDVPGSAAGTREWDNDMPVVGTEDSPAYTHVRFGITKTTATQGGGNLKGSVETYASAAMAELRLQTSDNPPQYKAVYEPK